MSKSKALPSPSRVTVHVDEEGIRAVNSRGSEIRITAPPSGEGFNPLELQSAALGICTAMTLRNELRQLSRRAPSSKFTLDVQGVKADNLPSRLKRLEVVISLPGDIDADIRKEVAHRAELACTIANTLRSQPAILTVLAGPPDPADQA